MLLLCNTCNCSCINYEMKYNFVWMLSSSHISMLSLLCTQLASSGADWWANTLIEMRNHDLLMCKNESGALNSSWLTEWFRQQMQEQQTTQPCLLQELSLTMKTILDPGENLLLIPTEAPVSHSACSAIFPSQVSFVLYLLCDIRTM